MKLIRLLLILAIILIPSVSYASTETLDLGLGRIYWSALHDYVGSKNAHGFHLTLWESSGIVYKKFVIYGPSDEMELVKNDILAWENEIKSSD